MPIYEFQCRKCGHVFEVRVEGLKSSGKPECSECGQSDVERLWSTFSQGSGKAGSCGGGGVSGFR